MGKLTEDDIRQIIKRASILQKFNEQAPNQSPPFIKDDYDTLYEIGESISIKPQFLNEALIEFEGIPIDEPISVDTNNASESKILGYANGTVDSGILNELKAQLEYHFNTVGKISRRRNMIFWKASPAWPAKLFETSTSPELQIEQDKGRIKLTLSQNLKTYNKLYLPAAGISFAAIMMFAAVVFEESGSDGTAPMLIFSGLFLGFSTYLVRLINRKKVKKKKKLVELMEVLQQSIERRFRTSTTKQTEKERISIPDFEDSLDDIEVPLKSSTKT